MENTVGLKCQSRILPMRRSERRWVLLRLTVSVVGLGDVYRCWFVAATGSLWSMVDGQRRCSVVGQGQSIVIPLEVLQAVRLSGTEWGSVVVGNQCFI